VYHSHDGLAPHSHEPIYSPDYFSCRLVTSFEGNQECNTNNIYITSDQDRQGGKKNKAKV
ncbi:unnamed protein product, partial [Brassica oleracea var. botrytis]